MKGTIHAVLATGLLALANATAEVSIANITQKDSSPSDLHAFANEPLALTLWLKGTPRETVSLTAQFFPAAGDLTIPLAEPLALGQMTFDEKGQQSLEVALPIPDTTKMVDLIVRFEATSGGKAQLAGTAKLFAYPRKFSEEDLATLAATLKAGRRQLGVFGEDTGLREFLKDNAMPFTDLGAGLPLDLSAHIFYVGQASEEALRGWKPRREAKGSPVVIFTEDPHLLPGIYVTTREDITFAKVTFPVLATLQSNPASQATFLATLSQISAQSEP